MKIAVIGAGISGLGAAAVLDKHHDVTLYEKESRIGGHSRTVTAQLYDGSAVPVDTGFIVYNHKNYPLLTALFDKLHVPTAPASMSFGVSMQGVTEYGSEKLSAIFADKRNIFRPAHWRMILDILKFNRNAVRYIDADPSLTLNDALREMKLSKAFRDRYLLPMGGAIWSCTPEDTGDFPAASFIRFFDNHGLLTVNDQPQWYSVVGGSTEYIKRITAEFSGTIRTDSGVASVIRNSDGTVTIIDHKGQSATYDKAILACHADQALAMLDTTTTAEQDVLSAFRYSVNDVVLHTDASFMPRRRAAWSSWVYLEDADGSANTSRISLTYWMNNLQRLDTDIPVFVTLNPGKAPEDTHFINKHVFRHPIYDTAMLQAQQRLPDLQGEGGVYFCGAYHRYGFHEDGLASGVAVTELLGTERFF